MATGCRMGGSGWWFVLLRLSYLAVSSVFAFIRLLSMSDADKDIEILTLRHQLAVLQRRIDRPRMPPADRALLAALLHRVPRPRLRQLRLIVAPEAILRWHRDLMRRRHAGLSRRKRTGRPPTLPQPSAGRCPRRHPGSRSVPGQGEQLLGVSAHPR